MLLLDEGLPTLHLGEANISPLFGRRLCGIDPSPKLPGTRPFKGKVIPKGSPKRKPDRLPVSIFRCKLAVSFREGFSMTPMFVSFRAGIPDDSREKKQETGKKIQDN